MDAGATDSLVPRSYIKAIGMEPADRRVYGIADGRKIALDPALARIEFIGNVAAGCIIGGEGAEPTRGHGPGVHQHQGGLGELAIEAAPGVAVEARGARTSRNRHSGNAGVSHTSPQNGISVASEMPAF